MSKRTLSIFVDESGILTESAARSRFYILTLLCHDQSFPIKPHADALDSDMTTIGIANLCFHASPVIHANDQFEFLTWDLRRKIFTRMLGFARRIKFGYHCIVVDKKYTGSPEQIASRLYLETKLDLNLPLSNSEIRFFGGPRMFKRNVLKYLKRKEI